MAERTIDYLPVDDIPRTPENPKRHAADVLDASLARHGYMEPVLLDERTGRLIGGHGRLDALQARHAEGHEPPDGVQVGPDGAWLVPVVRGWASSSDLDAAAALVTLNRATELGGWDDTALGQLLQPLTADPDGLAGVGYTAEEVAALLDPTLIHVGEHDRRPESEEPLPVPADPVTQVGDLWQLGAHRLVCGDSTDPDVFTALMGGGMADCVWTDPPYGVEYVGKTADALTIQNDAPKGLRGFLAAAWTACTGSVEPGSPWYVASPARPLATEFRLSLADAGWRLHEALVWVKDVFVLGHSDYHLRHEDILYGWLPGEGRSGRGNHDGSRWYGDHARSSVFEIPRPKRSAEHPTMKPVELIEQHLSNSTPPGGTVLDPFAGSGSTLIAAHNLGLASCLVELDPGYCDVILDRWERHGGTAPVKAADG